MKLSAAAARRKGNDGPAGVVKVTTNSARMPERRIAGQDCVSLIISGIAQPESCSTEFHVRVAEAT